MTVTIHHGDCLAVLKTLDEHSVDSIVTDPPYGLSFMGKHWDYDVPAVDIWRECLRVLKPGGHVLSFSGTRTYHRMVVNIEDAGFEIRDQIGWLYGSGFPKSRNLDGDWEGWGTALKPAWEPVVMARKPLVGTVAQNVQTYGTGAINIDQCRVEHVTVGNGNLALNPHLRTHINGGNGGNIIAHEDERRVVLPNPMGRWPANIIHDGSEEVLEVFESYGDKSSPWIGNPKQVGAKGGKVFGGSEQKITSKTEYGDSGTAARFFYCAKASKKERFESKHPTVKPLSLMKYLVRLVSPPGGVVLDPFAGSGTTGQAAVEEGMAAILIEREADYIEDIRRRLSL